jgi:hypothetical protein
VGPRHSVKAKSRHCQFRLIFRSFEEWHQYVNLFAVVAVSLAVGLDQIPFLEVNPKQDVSRWLQSKRSKAQGSSVTV